jgi:hypothetical protein
MKATRTKTAWFLNFDIAVWNVIPATETEKDRSLKFWFLFHLIQDPNRSSDLGKSSTKQLKTAIHLCTYTTSSSLDRWPLPHSLGLADYI